MSGGCCPVILGATAVGKTALVVTLAQRYRLEIISLDSRQIYRGLRIGTAQPSAEEQAACAHHLVDFISPSSTYSAARYRDDFARVFQEIHTRGKQPLLVGGAGFYLTGLREGFLALPEVSEARTEAVRNELDRLSDEEIRNQLHACDPESSRRIHANDRYRSQRALELQRLSGRTASELLRDHRPDPCLGLDYPAFHLIRPAEELKARIEVRTAAMLDAGWIEETDSLLAAFGGEAPGLQTLGYREIGQHLRGEVAREELAPLISLRTGQYAKRQRTWFRHTDAVAKGHPEDQQTLTSLTGWLDALFDAK